MKKTDYINKMDKDGDGIISREEIKEFLAEDDYVYLVCPMTGNGHSVHKDKLEHFKKTFSVDDTWEIK